MTTDATTTGRAGAASLPEGWLVPAWPAPAAVRAFVTTRAGGRSAGPWGLAGGAEGGMNLGLGSGEPADRVLANRAALASWLPAEPAWLRQVHGSQVVRAPLAEPLAAADASWTTEAGVVCVVLVADCMPVFLCDAAGRAVAVAHAGWRGLAAGVLQATAAALRLALGDPDARLLAWCGPAIGPRHFEVGPEVLAAMRERLPDADAAFRATEGGKYYADLPRLAQQALAQAGVDDVAATSGCTYSDAVRFYSYRRDGVTGRHAAVIWRNDGAQTV